MKTLNELNNDVEVHRQKMIKFKNHKYGLFMKMLSNVINTVLSVNKEAISSYFEEPIHIEMNNYGIHYVGIIVEKSEDGFFIKKFTAHDQYYDPVISFESSPDETLINKRLYDMKSDAFKEIGIKSVHALCNSDYGFKIDDEDVLDRLKRTLFQYYEDWNNEVSKFRIELCGDGISINNSKI